jgi:transposase
VKLHIGVDILGLPYAAIVTTANITDRNGAIAMFSQPEFHLPTLKTVLCDGGYTGELFAIEIEHLTGAKVEVAKRSELHTFAVIPKRWIVERTFGWLDKCRRLWKNCERKLENTLNMVKFAFVSLLLRRYKLDA